MSITDQEVFEDIKNAINGQKKNDRTCEIHIQMLKYAIDLEHITAREFCIAVGLDDGYKSEFNKMKRILPRLKKAGLDVDLL